MAAKTFLNLANGVKMPTLGLGTFPARDLPEFEVILKAALDLGYRHFDTAAYLFENEAVIGKIFKEAIDSGKVKREELFISTKLPPTGMSPDLVEHHLKESLEKLQLDYVDLYLIHTPMGYKPDASENPNPEEPKLLPKADHIGIWKEMEKQVKAGRAKTIGLANFNVSQIRNIVQHAEIKPANIQAELHPYFQQKELLKFCKQNGITVVAYGPFGSYTSDRFQTDHGDSVIDLPNVVDHPTIKEIAKKYSKTSTQVVLRFLLQLGVAVIAPKDVASKTLKQYISIFDFLLAEVDFKKLKELDLGEKARAFTFSRIKGARENEDYPYFKD